MKKIKNPWYGIIWVIIWTGALAWFLQSGMFNQRESIGLVLVWVILVGITGYLLGQHLRSWIKRPGEKRNAPEVTPSRNGPCPCGSGKKYKRCCAVKEA